MTARELTIREAASRIRKGLLTAEELVTSCIERIHRRESSIRAWVEVYEKEALEAAKRCDAAFKKGEPTGDLHGIPVGVKDIIDVEGMWTRAGCRVYPARIAESDAPVIHRLKQAGAIILGKTETTAFANNDPTVTRNPWNPEHTPGGSSSGSAAAVADRMCLAAVGSQTGGSVIRPASYNGIVGFKPTAGSVSLKGVVPVSWGLDHVGLLARCVEDARLLCRVMREDRPRSFLKVPHGPAAAASRRFDDKASGGASGTLRLGFFPRYLEELVSPDFSKHLESVRSRFRQAGAEIIDLVLPPSFSMVHDSHRTLFDIDLACYHRELFAEKSDQYPPNIRARIGQGLKIPGYRYVEALRWREIFQDEIYETLSQVDAAFMAASVSTAPRGLSSTGSAAANAPWSFCGFPAATLPSGLDEQGLPFGVQIVGLPWADEALASAAGWCEKVLAFDHAPGE